MQKHILQRHLFHADIEIQRGIGETGPNSISHGKYRYVFPFSAAFSVVRLMGFVLQARCLAPSIIFIDEVDCLVGRQNATHDHEASRRFQAELLIQMDGLQEER